MENIKLRFVNKSNDTNYSRVVIFQKNVATSFDSLAVAWKVIKHCGKNDYHPFEYPMTFQISAKDSYGNYMPEMDGYDGSMYAVSKTSSGHCLAYKDVATVGDEVQVKNSLSLGAIDAYIKKDGRVLAQKTGISPEEKASFKFLPKIFIGVVSQIQEGDVINSAILTDINTELDLTGLSSADIIMTGGGTDSSATRFQFSLENQVSA